MPQTKPKSKPATRSAEPKQNPLDEVIPERLAQLVGKATLAAADRMISELALEENSAGRTARKVLRARRDGNREIAEKLVKPLFFAIGVKIMESTKNDKTEDLPRDPQTGEVLIGAPELPKEWR